MSTKAEQSLDLFLNCDKYCYLVLDWFPGRANARLADNNRNIAKVLAAIAPRPMSLAGSMSSVLLALEVVLVGLGTTSQAQENIPSFNSSRGPALARSPVALACTAGSDRQGEEPAGNWLGGCNIVVVGIVVVVAGVDVACPLTTKRADAVAGNAAAAVADGTGTQKDAYGRCIDNGLGLVIFRESFVFSC